MSTTPLRTLVLGSNRGIGLEVTRTLVERGDHVIAGCRRVSPELAALAANGRVDVREGIDVTDFESLAALAASLGEHRIDRLWVVAGVLDRGGLTPFDAQSLRRQFEVNALGPLQAVVALQSCLARGSKIALLTSRMGSIADNGSGGMYGYRMSKAALNMAGKSLALDLAPRGISVVLLHPGFVRTAMTGGAGNVDAVDSAADLVRRVDALEPKDSGSFLHANGEALPW
jgi:NAD(P)-dependent dehydrogenase (short-subunit alcohol dehydrogenase family)